MKKIEIVIEKSDNNLLWGRVNYNDNLIVDSGDSVSELENKLKVLLRDFEGVDIDSVEFVNTYDVYALFKKFDFLKISSIADYAGINSSLLRQYASGVKNPGEKQVKKIENALKTLSGILREARVSASNMRN